MGIFDDMQAENAMRARAAYTRALNSGETPEQAAEKFRVAREFGVPVQAAGAITSEDMAQRQADAIPWQAESNRQQTFLRYLSDADFANFVKDDITNTGYLESAWWKISGFGGKPEDTMDAARSSTARGGYGLVNTLPGAGNIDRLTQYRRALDRLNEIDEGIAQGKSDMEIFGVSDERQAMVLRAQHNLASRKAREILNQRIQEASESMAWANSMIARYPQSETMQAVRDAKTAGEAVAAALSHPIDLLANVGPESLVQFTPALAGLAVSRGTNFGAALPIFAGTYSYGLDKNAGMVSGVMEALAESGVNTSDPEAIANFIRSDARFNGIEREAIAHAVPVAILDGISLGLAGKAIPKALPESITRIAPSTSRMYAQAMSSPYRAELINLGVQSAVQGTLGATGEALGQINAQGEVESWGEVVAEFAGEYFTAPVEVASASLAVSRTLTEAKAIAQAKSETIAELTQRARESKALARDPETIRGYLQAVEQRGEGAGDFYVDAEALQQEGLADELAAVSDSMRQRVDEALRTGGSVRIPYSEYVTDVARLPVADRVAPVLHQEGQPTDAEVDDIAASVTESANAEIAASARDARSDFGKSLRRVGRQIDSLFGFAQGLTVQGIGSYKTLLTTLVGNLAQDAGMAPEEVWQDYGIQGILGSGDIRIDENGKAVLISEAAKNALGKNNFVDLKQQSSKKALGSFFPEQRVVAIYGNADRSTFIHESGHWYLDARVRLSQALRQKGELTDSQRYIIENTEAALKEFGIKSLDDYANASVESIREAQEKFARSYEQYLYEGHAPTTALRNLFRRFSAWLKSVYGAITAIPGSQMSDEVRALFDRLFTASQQVNEAQLLRGFRQALDSGIMDSNDPDVLAAWSQQFSDATDEAIETMTARGMRAMAYLRNLRGRVTRQLQRQADAYRKELEPEVREELLRNKTFALLDLLTNGREIDGTRRVPKFFVDDLRKAGISQEVIERLRNRGFTVKIKAPSRIAPEELATGMKFSSVAAMIDALDGTKSYEETLADAVEKRMLDEHGEFSTEGGIRRLADEAIFNPSLARMIAIEINFLEDAKGTSRVTASMFRDAAAAALRNAKVRDLRPGAARDAAARLGRQAQAALAGRGGRTSTDAARLKRQQLYQTQVAIVSQNLLNEIDRAVRHFNRRFNGRKKLDSVETPFLMQIQTFMYAFGLTNRAPMSEAPSYDEFAKTQLEQDGVQVPPMSDTVRSVLPSLTHPEGLKLADMTVEQADAVLGFMSELEQAARGATKLRIGARTVELNRVRGELSGAIEAHAAEVGKKLRIPNERAGWRAKAQDAVDRIGIAHRRISSLLASMEGKTGGKFFEYVLRPFDRAATREQGLRTEYAVKLQKVMKPLEAKLKNHGAKHYAEIGASLTGHQLVSVLLNWGNDVNAQRLIDGSDQYDWTDIQDDGTRHKWTAEGVRRVIEKEFSAEELQAAQDVWRLFDELWPEVVALEERMGNRPPVRQEPRSSTFTLNDGQVVTLEGGYYPIRFDRGVSDRSAQQEDEAASLAQFGMSASNSTTYQGFVKSRAASAGGRPLSLTDRAGFEGLDAVIHDLSWREAIVNANKLFADGKELSRTIRNYWGDKAMQGIREWIKDCALGDMRQAHFSESWAGLIRQHVSLAGIGLNFVSAAIQLTGLTQTVALLGPKFAGIGVAEYMRNPMAAMRRVRTMSQFMEQRSQTQFRELREVQARLNGNIGSARDKWMRIAYVPLVWMQTVVDIPSWLGAYNKALSEGRTDADAIALADRFVADAQGSGRTADLSAIERNPSSVSQLMTVFYTFFNTAYNAALIIKDTQRGMKRALSLMTLLMLQPVLDSFMREAIGAAASDGSDDDWLEKALMNAGANTVSFNLGLFVGLRELSYVSGYFFDTDAFPYQGPAGLRLITDTGRLLQQISQGEADEGLLKAAISATGTFVGFPVTPFTRAVSGYNALSEGKTDNPLVLMFGYSDN